MGVEVRARLSRRRRCGLAGGGGQLLPRLDALRRELPRRIRHRMVLSTFCEGGCRGRWCGAFGDWRHEGNRLNRSRLGECRSMGESDLTVSPIGSRRPQAGAKGLLAISRSGLHGDLLWLPQEVSGEGVAVSSHD